MNAAAGLKHIVAFLTIDDLQPMAPTGAHTLDDLLAQPAQVDDDGCDAVVAEPCEVMFEQTSSPNLNKALGYRVGERSQALAASGRK